MKTGFFNLERQCYPLPFAKTEAPVVFVLLQIKFLRALEGEGGGLGFQDAVQGQAALVVKAVVAADQVQARALLGQAQGMTLADCSCRRRCGSPAPASGWRRGLR